MGLYTYLVAVLLLTAGITARGLLNNGRDYNVAVEDTTTESDAATEPAVIASDDLTFANDGQVQKAEDSADSTVHYNEKETLEEFLRHAANLGPDSLLGWSDFARQGPAPYTPPRGIPVRVVNWTAPLPLTLDTKMNVTVLNPALPVQVLNNSLNVQVSNNLLPVGIVNTSLPVDVTNTKLKVDVSNVPLPVTVLNENVGVKVADLPLPVGIVNTTLPVKVDTSVPLDTRILNVPIPVGVVNTTLAVNVANLPLGVDVKNAAVPVGVVNQTLSVSLADKPVPVGIVNQTLPVSLTNLDLKSTILNVPLPVGVVNSTLNVNVMNTTLPVVLLNRTVEVNSPTLLSGLTETLNNIAAPFQNLFNAKSCPTDSQFGTATTAPCRRLGSSCFCFFPTIRKTYAEASSFCQIAGFDGLLSLETVGKQLAVHDLARLLGITGIRYLTSGTDAAVEGSFLWKPSNTPFVSGLQWGPGEPNSSTGDEDCVVTDTISNGVLRDVQCSESLNFICELGNIQNSIGK